MNRYEAIEQALKEQGGLPNGKYCFCVASRDKTKYGHEGRCERANEALALPEDAEPKAWLSVGGDVSRSKKLFDELGFTSEPLYTHPPKTVEREALIKRIDAHIHYWSGGMKSTSTTVMLLTDIRAFLSGE